MDNYGNYQQYFVLLLNSLLKTIFKLLIDLEINNNVILLLCCIHTLIIRVNSI